MLTLHVNKGIIIGIGIAIIGAFFIIQDLGYQTDTDPNAPDPNANQDKFTSPEPPKTISPAIRESEPPEVETAAITEPEP